MAAARPRRRQILVDADLQVGLSMHILGWLYFYVVAFSLIANASSIWEVFTAHASDAAYYEAVTRLQWFTRVTVLPLAVTFVVVAFHGVVLTHRVAGPIYRFKMTLRDMAQRRYAANGISLRKKDYFKDVAAEFNVVLAALREDAARVRRMNGETASAAKDLVGALERGAPPHEVLALANLALDRSERLERHLGAVEGDAQTPRVPLPAAEVEATLEPTKPDVAAASKPA